MRTGATALDIDDASDRGLTVLGLIVTVAVVAALGLGSMLLVAAGHSAADHRAKSRAASALEMQNFFFAESNRYGTGDEVEPLSASTDLEPYDPSEGAKVLGKVYVKDPSGNTVTLVTRSDTGKCFWTRTLDGVVGYAVTDCETIPSEFKPSW